MLRSSSAGTKRIQLRLPSSVWTHNIQAVPSAFWDPSISQFLVPGWDQFVGFVRFDAACTVKRPGEKMTAFQCRKLLLVLHVVSPTGMRAGFIEEQDFAKDSGTRSLTNPFEDIERFGPLGEERTLKKLVRLMKDMQSFDLVESGGGSVDTCVAWCQVSMHERRRIWVDVGLTLWSSGKTTVGRVVWWLNQNLRANDGDIPPDLTKLVAKDKEQCAVRKEENAARTLQSTEGDTTELMFLLELDSDID